MNKVQAHIEYGLQGAFKVDTYDKNNQLASTTDWFSNFITQTGLMYPTIYSFANCFRFLTLGADASTTNKGGTSSTPTTGCYNPLSNVNCDWGNGVIAGQDFRWLGHTAYETGTSPENSACITRLTDTGPVFYRAWTIPASGCTIGDAGGLLIGEFMVSPSSGGDPTGRYAFSRVVRPLPLPQGYRAVISYQLRVNIKNSSLTFFSGIFDTGNANVENDPDLILQWRRLSGFYKQVWCGLSCVDKYGATFVPKFGNVMEPSLSDFKNYFVYLSPDNAQFDANVISGGTGIDRDAAWSSDGLMLPLGNAKRPALDLNKDMTTQGLGTAEEQYTRYYGPEQELTDVPLGDTPYNIRLGSDLQPLRTVNLKYYTGDIRDEYLDQQFNYQSAGGRYVSANLETISYANPGSGGINLSRSSYFHERAIFSSRIFKLPMNMALPANTYMTGRRKTVSRKVVFAPASSLGYNTRFGSLVLAHKLPDDSATAGNYTYYPTIDCLFYDSSGGALLQHYRQVSGIAFLSRGSGLVNSVMDIKYSDGTAASSNITRSLSLRTFHGPIVSQGPTLTGRYTIGFLQSQGLLSGNLLFSGGWGGNNPSAGYVNSGNTNFYDSTGNFNGWGSIYGVISPTGWLNFISGQQSNYQYSPSRPDQGIAWHTTGMGADNPTGLLYWPNVFGGKILDVKFSSLVFSGKNSGQYWADDGTQTDAYLASMGFCRPTGVIIHYDNIGAYGYRMLPNFGRANINTTDNYAPLEGVGYGGALPGLSLDNGLEVYIDVSWGSPCGGADQCNEPTL